MADHEGQRLRRRREELGLSLQALSAELRIPVHHLSALEEGRDEDLPAGPWRDAYLRKVHERLALEGPADEAPPPPTPSGPPLWLARATALIAVVLLLGVVGWRVGGPDPVARLAAAAARFGGAPEPGTVAPDQHVVVHTKRPVALRVTVDGEIALDREVASGERLEFDARDRISIDVPAVDAVKVEYNGDAIVPQGRQDEPRRLEFVDDLGNGW
jgi:hypothetical protein